jgi:acetylornithine aminotransferase
MNTEINLATEQQLFFHNYSRLPLDIAYGKGSFLYTTSGERYLDMIAGIGVNAVGYGDSRLEQAITEQAAKYIHVSNLFMQKPQFDLAAKLLDITGFSKVFFCNSGTEAIEAAIKLSRRFAARNGDTEKAQVLSLTNCFHGRTYGALSLTAKPKYVGGFEPLVPETGMIDFNDVEDLEKKVSGKTAAVFVEFVQGEGGIHRVNAAFISRLKELAEEHDFLIVADEIQAGCGRTGTFFSYMPYNIMPDLVCAAKPLGGGLPLGAIIGSEKVAEVFTPGSHGTTFGGNPVACAAGLAMIEAIQADDLMQNTLETGAMMRASFEKMAEKHAQILEIRQYGLMIGVTVHREAKYYVEEAMKRGVLVNATSNNVIRLLPPLSISRKEAQLCLDTLDAIFTEEEQAQA